MFAGGMLILGAFGSAFAQVPLRLPQLDAGALDAQRQQMERANREQLRPEADTAPVITTPNRPSGQVNEGGPKFLLNRVKFTPSAFIEPAELDAIAQPLIGKQVDMGELNTIVDAVNRLYVERRIATALAILAPQRIEGGVVTIELVEGKLSRAQVDSQYTNSAFVLSHLALHDGAIVDIPRLERDLIWFNRTHEVQLSADIKPGESRGTTDISIEVKESPRVVSKVFADNQESRTLGRYQAGLDLRLNGVLGRADVFSALVSKSRGGTNGYLGYAIPFNRRGGQVTFSISRNNISIIDGPYSALGITGISRRLAASLTQPIYVDQQWLVSLGYTRAKSRSENAITSVPLSRFEIDSNILSSQVGRQGAGYQWTIEGSLERGKSVNQFNTDQSYTLRSMNASSVVVLGSSWYGVARAALRKTDASMLPPAALFQLGGSGSVRGYESGAVSGTEGSNFGLEFHRPVALGWDGFLFYDRGSVHSPSLPTTTISGTGVGASWTEGRYSLRMVLGRPLNKVRPEQDSYRADLRLEIGF